MNPSMNWPNKSGFTVTITSSEQTTLTDLFRNQQWLREVDAKYYNQLGWQFLGIYLMNIYIHPYIPQILWNNYMERSEDKMMNRVDKFLYWKDKCCIRLKRHQNEESVHERRPHREIKQVWGMEIHPGRHFGFGAQGRWSECMSFPLQSPLESCLGGIKIQRESHCGWNSVRSVIEDEVGEAGWQDHAVFFGSEQGTRFYPFFAGKPLECFKQENSVISAAL